MLAGALVLPFKNVQCTGVVGVIAPPTIGMVAGSDTPATAPAVAVPFHESN
jgi:hypothetical protein